MSTVLTACASLVGCAAAIAATGGLATVLLAGSAATGVYGVLSEVNDTMSDDKGTRVNTKYLITQLAETTGDLNSVTGNALQVSNNGMLEIGDNDSRKLAVTQQQLDAFRTQFKKSLDPKVSARLSKAIDSYFKAVEQRNQDILTYTRAVVSLAERRSQGKLLAAQAEEMGSQAVRSSGGLPSIVAYYERLRSDARVRILRTIRQAALALRFWGLNSEAVKFSGPGLLAGIDELRSHVQTLEDKHENILQAFSDFPQNRWPVGENTLGVTYKLSPEELGGLRLPQNEVGKPPVDDGTTVKCYTVTIEGLRSPARGTAKTIDGSQAFSGKANIRISQVRLWVPGLKRKHLEVEDDLQSNGGKSKDASSPLKIIIEHGGNEAVIDPFGVEHTFNHNPVHLTFEYPMNRVTTAADIHWRLGTVQQVLPSDWRSANALAMNQAAIGPFAAWTVSISESDNGRLDWTDVRDAYLEFCGSSMTFAP